MTLTLRCASLVCLALSLFVLAQAQSADELRAKYGDPIEAYEIRPHVLLTAKRDPLGKVIEYVIEPRHTTQFTKTEGDYSALGMLARATNEIVKELAPESIRGNEVYAMSFSSSCNGVWIQVFEHLEISTSSSCDFIQSVVIRWKDRTGMRPVSLALPKAIGITQ